MQHGYVKVAVATPFVKVADCNYNIERKRLLIERANQQGVEILLFPELGITGYSCGDLFLQPFLLEESEKALLKLVHETRQLPIAVIVGMPIRIDEKLFNSAVLFQEGKILGAIPKTYLPNYREFQEKRWFSPSNMLLDKEIVLGTQVVPFGANLLFQAEGVGIGIEICEDMWTPYTPGTRLALNGAHILFNLSTSNEVAGKHDYLRSLISGLSSQALSGYVYASSGHGESSTDLVYTGKGFIAELGEIISEMDRFELAEKMVVSDIDAERIQNQRLQNSSFKKAATRFHQPEMVRIPFKLRTEELSESISRPIDPNPFMPSYLAPRQRSLEIFQIQVAGLVQRLRHIGAKYATIGISGGLDSTLALLVTLGAFDLLSLDRRNIIAVTMPGLGTTKRSLTNARKLMQLLGVTSKEISISEAVIRHFEAIGHDPDNKDTTYENVQARERTNILMNLANRYQGPVIGTGDLSEIALGWNTFNGDHMSMYAVNATVPKTSVKTILEQYAQFAATSEELRNVLLAICQAPISPELLPEDEQGGQHTESIIGPYELHDFFLYHMLTGRFSPTKIHFLATIAFRGKYDAKMIKNCLRVFIHRFFNSQYKRNAMPDGPKTTEVSLSPRGDWRMPSDATAKIWLDEVDRINA